MPRDEMKPPRGMDPAVFAYLSDAFARLSAMIADSTRASREAAHVAKDNAHRIERLEWHVFGPNPPPPFPPAPPVVPAPPVEGHGPDE